MLVRIGPVILKKMQVMIIEVITKEPISALFTLNALKPMLFLKRKPYGNANLH
jgi:hypothetical protein